jgi:hypothetical protein
MGRRKTVLSAPPTLDRSFLRTDRPRFPFQFRISDFLLSRRLVPPACPAIALAAAEASERRRKRSEDGLVASKLPWRRRIGFLISRFGFDCPPETVPQSRPGAGQCRKMSMRMTDPYPALKSKAMRWCDRRKLDKLNPARQKQAPQ